MQVFIAFLNPHGRKKGIIVDTGRSDTLCILTYSHHTVTTLLDTSLESVACFCVVLRNVLHNSLNTSLDCVVFDKWTPVCAENQITHWIPCRHLWLRLHTSTSAMDSGLTVSTECNSVMLQKSSRSFLYLSRMELLGLLKVLEAAVFSLRKPFVLLKERSSMAYFFLTRFSFSLIGFCFSSFNFWKTSKNRAPTIESGIAM